MYKKRNQKEMEKFYGLTDVIDISGSSQDWFARGHLSPAADFVYQNEKEAATYYYRNTAPQFESFNGQNWEHLETGVRKLAQR